VTFRISEGAKLKIRMGRHHGNQFHPTYAILNVMDTSEKGILSFITDSGPSIRTFSKNDVRKIEALYQETAGFMDSKSSSRWSERGRRG